MSNRRKLFVGTSISSGIVLGHARVVMPGDFEVAEVAVPASRLAGEAESLERAIEQTIEELKSLRESATRKMAGPVAKIFDAQLLIAGDYEFLKGVKRSIIQQKRNAAFVYNRSVQETTTPLKNSPDEYLQQMADDIEGVAKRVLSHLSGYGKCDLKLPTGTIIVGRSFSPGEILGYRERKAIGFVVAEGGRNSHSALIARALLLPMIVAKKAVTEIVPHSRVVVDGVAGEVIVNPSDDDWHNYQRSRKRLGSASITRIKKLTAIPPLTADGQAIQVGANLTLPGPADDLLASQAFPVGLYRTEFMYLQHDGFPDEEEQYQVYCQIAERFERSSVVIRTFDLGYDKFSRSEDWPEEDNPALGWRGLRAMLDMTPRFKTQVRAILR
ncbi:MAG: putative PEP-binding protein, partial [Candidatus Zixiibacteriota bacterium]